MDKKHFIALIAGIISGFVFSIGVCMMLLPDWGMSKISPVFIAIGAAALLFLAIWLRKTSGNPAIKPNWKLMGKIAYGTVSALVLGAGMSMIMAFEGMMLAGVIVGFVGIIMLVCLIPMFTGFKKD